MRMLFGYTIDDAIEGIKKYIREMMKGYVNDVHENMIKNYTGINSWTLYNKKINGYDLPHRSEPVALQGIVFRLAPHIPVSLCVIIKK